MRVMVVGASKGLGRALVDGLASEAVSIIGVSRRKPTDLCPAAGVQIDWIEADMIDPSTAVGVIAKQAPSHMDAIIYNLGIWEEYAFDERYRFEDDTDARIAEMVTVNITGTILLLKRLIPRLLTSNQPRIILTGSTSGLRQSGRPEVTFGASKHALNGIADALRESYREQRLAVSCLQLGYLNTDDNLSVPVAEAASRGDGELIPLHDVVAIVDTMLKLSPSSFVREMTLPAILDPRF